MALSPDGRLLFVAGGGTSAVYAVDTTQNRVVRVIRERMGRRPWGIAITPEGSKIYTANGLSDSVSVIDPKSFAVIRSVSVGRGPHSVVIGVAQ
jgi:YVTN family beta-propeller protein